MTEKRYTVGLYTLGCKVSSYETEAVAEAFADAGYEIRSFGEVCDVYVINTCTVTAESDAKSRKYIRRAVRMNPQAKVIVMGCYSQRSPREVAEIEGVSAVIGTANKLSVVKLAADLLTGGEKTVSVPSLVGAEFEKMTVRHAPRTRGYVKIEDGCECKCSYCAISDARGPVRSKPMADVIAEVQALHRSGTREVVLTGIETGSYGSDFDYGCDLADLILELDRLKATDRIRLGSMAPELLSERLVSRIAGCEIMVPHFHISMQSGSTSVLNRMRRRYTRETAMKNIALIRRLMPRVMLTADLMVGFPGETEEEFLDTVSFVREAELLDSHVFAYSMRAGTPAALMPGQIDPEVKHDRSVRLMAVQREVRDSVLSGVVDEAYPLPSVFETRRGREYTGHSDSYIEVRCESSSDIRGDIINVIPVYHKDGVLYTKIGNNNNYCLQK